jgi:deoxyadenosine/deoxycytidine kinase
MLLSGILGREDHFGYEIAEDFNAKAVWNVLPTTLLPKFYEDQNRYAFPSKCHSLLTDTSSCQMI